MKARFNVSDISCSHCAQSVTKAIAAVAPSAKVNVDVDTKHVIVDGLDNVETVASAIRDAGFTPEPLAG